MKRFSAIFGSLLCITCGPPSGASQATFKLVADGTGDAVVTHLPAGPGHRWTYELSYPTGGTTASTVWNEGSVTLPNGSVVDRRVTDQQVVYIQTERDGEYYWGADDAPLQETPIVQVSLPLKLGRVWTTGDAEFPDWYRYEVEAIETIDTPAGRFTAARLQQLNTKTGTIVARWYVEGVGMAQRVGLDSTRGEIARTHLLSYAGPEETP